MILSHLQIYVKHFHYESKWHLPFGRCHLLSLFVLQALFDLCLLAHAVTQVVQLCSANLTLADSGNRDDGGRVHREDLLTADTVGDTADGDGLVDAAMLLSNDGAFESLVTLTAAFLNTNENTDGIAHVHLGQFFLHVLLAENFNKIHDMIPFYV